MHRRNLEKSLIQPLNESEYHKLVEFAKSCSHPMPGPTECDVGSTENAEDLSSSVGLPSVANYQFLHRLGQGGMGTVWKVKQIEPVERELAIKLVHPLHSSGELQMRLEVERQALAMMEHPNIARMVDAGTTDEGKPFFAMELFEGQRLDQFCDREKLSIRSRLKLVIEICRAVQHAHQKGVIHRDLKPSNILVRNENGKPHVKVIDFGLAKSIDQLAEFKDDETEYGQVLGTFQYMSPEQANSDSVRIDSRTDVYSLGAVLYELLCGDAPFSKVLSAATPIREAIKIVVESTPPLPSQQLSDVSPDDDRLGARSISRSALHSVLVGDLNWIVMKAIDNNPDRRYQSSSEMALDIERFLQREPVMARPPTLGYRFRKFVSKHRLPVVAAALLGISMLAGVIGTSVGWSKAVAAQKLADDRFHEAESARQSESKAKLAEAQRAESEKEAKEHAEQLLEQTAEYNEVLRTIFKDLNPNQDKDDIRLERRLADQLIAAGEQIAINDYDKPKYQLLLLSELGETLIQLGFPQEAVELFERSVDIVDENASEDRLGWIAYTAANLVSALLANGNPQDAIVAGERSLNTYMIIDGPDHKNTISAMHRLATAELLSGDIDTAISRLEEVVPKRIKLSGPTSKSTLISMNVLATAYGRNFQFDKALPLMKQVLRARTETLGEDAVGTIITLSNLADTHSQLGNDALALEMQTDAYRRFKDKLGVGHPNTLAVQTKLAVTYKNHGDNVAARALAEAAIPLLEDRLGAAHPRTLVAKSLIGNLLRAENQTEQALVQLQLCYDQALEEHGESSPDTLGVGSKLIYCYAATGDFEKAIAFGNRVAQLSEETLGHAHLTTGIAKTDLAIVLAHQENWQGAQSLLENLIEAVQQKFSGPQKTVLKAKIELAKVLLTQGQSERAEKLLEDLQLDWGDRLSESAPVRLEIERQFARLRIQQEDWQAAKSILDQLMSVPDGIAQDNWMVGYNHLQLALVQFASDQNTSGVEHFEKGIAIVKRNARKIPFSETPGLMNVFASLRDRLESLEPANQKKLEVELDQAATLLSADTEN